jgi:teichoic acid transport system permease protein
MNTVRELLDNRKMIWKLSKNDFKTKYAGSYLVILWAFVQPIVTIMIYVIIFQFGFKAARDPRAPRFFYS